MFKNKEKYEGAAKWIFKFQIIFINAILIIAIIGTLFLDVIPIKAKLLIILIIISLMILISFVVKRVDNLIFVKLKKKIYRKKGI